MLYIGNWWSNSEKGFGTESEPEDWSWVWLCTGVSGSWDVCQIKAAFWTHHGFSLSLSWPLWHAYILLTFDLPWQTWGRGFKGLTFPWQPQCQSARRIHRETGSLTRTKWNFRRSLIIPSSLNVVTTIGMGKGLSRLRCYRYFCHSLSHSLPAESSRCQRWARSGRSGPYVCRDSGVERHRMCVLEKCSWAWPAGPSTLVKAISSHVETRYDSTACLSSIVIYRSFSCSICVRDCGCTPPEPRAKSMIVVCRAAANSVQHKSFLNQVTALCYSKRCC